MRKKKSKKPIKVCAACNAINVASHDTCYRCGWKGKFYNHSKFVDKVIKNLFDDQTEGKNGTHAVILTDR